ncbi:armadillo beta-catenin plakoglobin [Ceraceosorus bombacis]|uniref:uracil phosphoribosyltransferase n=1 Tax=Ceraceosorus bombacis TaxID=401625 RepID=A0A0P1BPQ1_9BASI|nr:armadillo beta-catenin plakoglobin [Ceraceosorus bombacis]
MSSSKSNSQIHKVAHPLLSTHLANLRLATTSPKQFRELVRNITTVLVVEATKDLGVHQVQGEGPLAKFEGEEISGRIGLVPILRAGLGMVDAALALLPENTSVQHIGLFREKLSLQPVEYYSKLPETPNVDEVLILDPLVATGGTAIVCVKMITDWGIPISKIRFLCVLGSEQGLNSLASACPGLNIWVGAIDQTLNDKGLIIPGLGDTGDRLHATQ